MKLAHTILLAAMLLLPAIGATAQSRDSYAEPSNFERELRRIRPGDKLIIQKRDGGRLKGKFAAVEPTLLFIEQRRQVTVISHGDISRIWRVKRKMAYGAAVSATWAGMLAAGFGRLLCTAGARDGKAGRCSAMIMPLFGGLAGLRAASSGGDIDIPVKKRILIYSYDRKTSSETAFTENRRLPWKIRGENNEQPSHPEVPAKYFSVGGPLHQPSFRIPEIVPTHRPIFGTLPESRGPELIAPTMGETVPQPLKGNKLGGAQ